MRLGLAVGQAGAAESLRAISTSDHQLAARSRDNAVQTQRANGARLSL